MIGFKVLGIQGKEDVINFFFFMFIIIFVILVIMVVFKFFGIVGVDCMGLGIVSGGVLDDNCIFDLVVVVIVIFFFYGGFWMIVFENKVEKVFQIMYIKNEYNFDFGKFFVFDLVDGQFVFGQLVNGERGQIRFCIDYLGYIVVVEVGKIKNGWESYVGIFFGEIRFGFWRG